MRDLPVFHCPLDPHVSYPSLDDPTEKDYTDYWINRDLLGKYRGFAADDSLVLVGEGDDGTDKTDSTYSLSGFPHKWLNDVNMPPSRHFLGANYLFADGHIGWVKHDRLTGPGAPRFKP